jgi:hypothetical protein
VTCTACGRVHLVNPKSGKVLESEKQLADVTRVQQRYPTGLPT